jgi:hypothetical protein
MALSLSERWGWLARYFARCGLAEGAACGGLVLLVVWSAKLLQPRCTPAAW